MPYSSANDPSLPSNVRALPEKRRRQWLSVFNSERRLGKSDGDAIRIANGVIKGSGRDLPPGFVPIESPSAPATAAPEVEVGLVDQLISFFRSSANDKPTRFELRELPNGRLRYYSIATNNYTDRGKLVFPEAAQRKYVEFVERTGKYPELWRWHARGSRFGQADKIFWVDRHIQFTSGLIDEGKEELALKLANRRDLGMSHGYVGAHVELPDGTIEVPEFVQFEQSVLPHKAAANFGTYFGLLGGAREIDMAKFTTEQREWFRSQGESDDRIDEMERLTSGMHSFFEEHGVDWRSLELDAGDPSAAPAASAATTSGAAAPAGAQNSGAGAAAGAPADGGGGGSGAPADAGLSEAILTEMRSMNASLRSFMERVEESDDQKFERGYRSRTEQLPRGFKASERGDSPESQQQRVGAGAADGGVNTEWMGDMFGSHPILGGNGRNQ